jgi:hypothetical protein
MTKKNKKKIKKIKKKIKYDVETLLCCIINLLQSKGGN